MSIIYIRVIPMKDVYAISTSLPIKGDKICLIGNRGHQNFGDELILIGLIKLLCQNISYKKLYIAGGKRIFLQNFHKYFFRHDLLVYFHYLQEIPHGIRSLLQFIIKTPYHLIDYIRCDTFILGGGELFTEETPGSYLYRRRSLMPVRVRLLFGFRSSLYLMGGVQMPSRWYNKLILKMIVVASAGSFLRDQESVEVGRSIRGTKNTAYSKDRWFIDTSYFALGGEPLEVLDTHHRSSTSDIQTPHIIINSNPLSSPWSLSLVEIIKSYLEQGYSIYFLPAFFTSNSDQDDMLCYRQLHAQFPSLLLLDRRDRNVFRPLFSSAHHIYCSRLHIFLMASFLSIPVTPYSYQKKISKNSSILKMTGILK